MAAGNPIARTALIINRDMVVATNTVLNGATVASHFPVNGGIARRILVPIIPELSQVIVVPHGAKIIPPNIQPNQVVPIIKHVMKGVCKPYLHHHSASQGLEAFFPRNDHPAYNPTPYPSPRFTFEYSRCTGRKRALCVSIQAIELSFQKLITSSLKIGINYYGSDRPLKGCINDAIHIRDYLISE
ncbi:hypothetical protein AAF712_005360 [Marasmius tenuissimus]|uniref:Uncharacterized protein n=1 Tax=Marasmius tenuissimus TaxID=585030 RepID=A0ABR3A283_9AGAR